MEDNNILKISSTLGKVDVLKSKNELQGGDNYLILTAYQSDTDKLMDYLKKLESSFGVSFTIAKDIDLYNNDKYTSFYCKINQDNINKISTRIPVICFHAGYNKNCIGDNIIRCYSWYDIYSKINKMVQK